MTDPFATPGSTTGIDYASLNGRLLLVDPASLEANVKTSLGEKEAVRATITILDGGDAGSVLADGLVFPRVLIGQLRSRMGQKVLGRLGQGVAKPGQSPPWTLSEATEADKAVGLKWLATGLATPAAASSKEPPF
jgi:hypothetical protein